MNSTPAYAVDSQEYFDAHDEAKRRGVSAPQCVIEKANARETERMLPGQIEALATKEQKLKKEADAIDAERERLVAVTGQWRGKIAELGELRSRVATLENELRLEREGIAQSRQYLRDFAGDADRCRAGFAGNMARNIVGGEAACPLLEEALRELQKKVAAQLAGIATFAKANKVPAEHLPAELRK